jgi:two-component sensor histidine kinase
MIYTDDDGREIWTNVAAVPTFDDARNVTGVLTAISDIDERKRSEQALRESERRATTLLAELQHRVRNVLAMVRSMVRRAAASKTGVPDFVDHLQGRIDAMARTQSALTRAPGRGVELEGIVRDELLAFVARDEGFKVKGPALVLAPKAAEVLTLAIHELAANSLKYGALGADKDARISWQVHKRRGEKWLEFVWDERGVEIDDTNPSPGFGTELITQRVPYELGGDSVMTFRKDGMTATIRFPLTGEQSVLQTDSGPENWKGGL